MASTSRFGKVGLGELGITFRIDANELVRLTDAVTGYFLGGEFQRQLEAAHHEMAGKVQEGIVDKYDERFGLHGQSQGFRPQRPGERLLNALRSVENREVTASGFRVGIPSWYDRSPVKLYWRSIEEGLGEYETTALFTTNFTKFYGPGGGGYPDNLQMRMPQHLRRAPKVHVREFRGYQFHIDGAEAVYSRLDVASIYVKYGVPLTQIKGLGSK